MIGPAAVLKPESEAELADIICRARGPFAIRGGGTRPVGLLSEAPVLSVAGLSGITLYEPAALTLVAGAGTPLAEIEAVLAAEGQRLAFEPGDWRGLMGTAGEPTIGGVAAANISGPRRVQAGAARDAVLGLRFVDGTGAVVKAGGRVMKNVTGYDLCKLLCGSRGTLGVITEVALKVLPAPAGAASLLVAVEDAAGAVAAMTAALSSPYDVTGAAWLPGIGAEIRIEGLGASVAYRAAALEPLMAAFGAVTVDRDPEAVAATWRAIRDVAAFQGRAGDVWRLSLRPSQAPAVAAASGGEQLWDWGGGLIWALLPEGSDARAGLPAHDGHATLIRAGAATRAKVATFPPEVPEVAALSRGLRQRFDPRGILNPGLMD